MVRAKYFYGIIDDKFGITVNFYNIFKVFMYSVLVIGKA